MTDETLETGGVARRYRLGFDGGPYLSELPPDADARATEAFDDYFPYGSRELPTRPEDTDERGWWYDRDAHEWRNRNRDRRADAPAPDDCAADHARGYAHSDRDDNPHESTAHESGDRPAGDAARGR
jgi:hypothetical protein